MSSAQPITARGHRLLSSSEASYITDLSATYEEDLVVNLRLLDFLESTEPTSSTKVVQTQTSDNQLGRLLSQHTVVSTTSTFAETQAAAAQSENSMLRKIGAGSCGAMFARDGAISVYKLQRNLFGGKVADLFNDFLLHGIIRRGIMSVPEVCNEIKVPELYAWIPRTKTDFWEENEHFFKLAADANIQLPCNMLRTERILPLPDPIRASLINNFCPLELRDAARKDITNRDCLVRVYLGRFREQDGRRRRYFSLRNFPMHINQMLEIGANVQEFAVSIAGALAALHWKACVDARDVEFVLGSSPTLTRSIIDISANPLENVTPETYVGPSELGVNDWHRRKVRLWLLDFNLCSQIPMDEAGVAMAAEAWRLNDPYFPRPLQDSPACKELWNVFVSRYIDVADLILEKSPHLRELPRKFIKSVIDIEKKRIERRAEIMNREAKSK